MFEIPLRSARQRQLSTIDPTPVSSGPQMRWKMDASRSTRLPPAGDGPKPDETPAQQPVRPQTRINVPGGSRVTTAPPNCPQVARPTALDA